jgi:hypothetical protein
MESWQILAGLVASAVVGGFIKEKFFSSPATVASKVAALESKIAVIEATKLTEAQVRTIVHEQIQPMMISINEILKDQKRQGDLLSRIDERLEKQERQ